MFFSDHQRPINVWFNVIGLYCIFNRYICSLFYLKGYRCVPLKNGYSEDMELASLLVHINIRQAGVSKHTAHIYTSPLWLFTCDHMTVVAQRAEEELYSSSNQLKKKQSEVSSEPFLYDTHSNLQRSTIPRQHNHLMREYSTSTGQTLTLTRI